MRRSSPLLRKALKKRAKRVSAQARREYETATENARTPDGYLRCQSCGRGLLDRDAERHHLQHRSQGGQHVAGNLSVQCRRCHSAAHGIRVIEPDAQSPVSGGALVAGHESRFEQAESA